MSAIYLFSCRRNTEGNTDYKLVIVQLQQQFKPSYRFVSQVGKQAA